MLLAVHRVSGVEWLMNCGLPFEVALMVIANEPEETLSKLNGWCKLELAAGSGGDMEGMANARREEDEILQELRQKAAHYKHGEKKLHKFLNYIEEYGYVVDGERIMLRGAVLHGDGQE